MPLWAVPAFYKKWLIPQLRNGGIKSFYMADALNTALFIIYFCFLRLFRHPNYSLLFIASISFSISSSLSSEKWIKQLWIRLLFPYVYWLTPKTTIIFLYHIILQNTTIFIIRISLSALNFARRTYKAIPHNYCRRIAPSDCINWVQAGWSRSSEICAGWWKICKQDVRKAVRRSLWGVALKILAVIARKHNKSALH